MEAAEKVPKVILGWRTSVLFGNGVQEQDKEELETRRGEKLLGIFPDDMVIWQSPASWVEV